MQETLCARRGLVTAPHHLAAQAGLDILKDGGSAVEAAIAVASTLAVVYPHMTGIGGDGFWIVAEPGRRPFAIDACGRAAAQATPGFYADQGFAEIPTRGPLAALTVAGTVSGWGEALDATRHWGRPLPVARLLDAARVYATDGFSVTRSQAETTAAKRDALQGQPGFASTFLPNAAPPRAGDLMRLSALGATLDRLGRAGLADLYVGDLARAIGDDLAAAGSPLRFDDLAAHRASRVEPLSVAVRPARLFNTPPPTQGVASLMILALFDRLGVSVGEGFAHVHGLVEATKQAFLVRDRHVGDPDAMTARAGDFLDAAALDALARRIDRSGTLPWPWPSQPGDTTWFGVCDAGGRVVSAIQSIYFEFGSGVVLPRTGLCWQNRGSSFRLGAGGWNVLAPGRKPFHTLNPALAMFPDGRVMAFGTMGGEGQPQTQAAVFTRYGHFGMPLQQAVNAPRWLLGRTWGDASTALKLESRFPPALAEDLLRAGHAVEWVPGFSDVMGHAGAVVRHADGLIAGATDPRSDGGVAAW